MLFPTPTRALALLTLALFQIASVSASPMPQALPLDLVTDLASTAAGSGSLAPVHANTNTNNAAGNANANMNTNTNANTGITNINTPTDTVNVKHSAPSSPLDLESLPLLGSLDSSVPLGGEENAASVQNGNSASGESAGEAHPSGPLSLLGRRAVYGASPRAGAASIGIPASNAAYTLEGNWEDGATHSKLSMPVGRAERFRARWMRRASLGLGSV